MIKRKKSLYLNKSFEALFKESIDAIVHIDADHRVIDINEAFMDLFGYTLSEIQGNKIDDVMNMGCANSSDWDITASVLSGNKIIEEGIRYRKDGTPIEVLIKGLPIIINGSMAGAYGIYADITDRKQAEKILMERESKYNAIFEGSHDCVTVLREDGRFIDCNQQALEMFGVQCKEDFLKARPADFSPILQPNGSSSMELSQIYIAEALETGDHVHFEWMHKRCNDETFSAEVILKAFLLDGNTVLQGSVRDISDRKKSEHKLRYMSFHDNLTGCYNRTYLDEEIKRLDTARQLPLSIAMIDLNGLKLINDTYGHATGDEALKIVAGVLRDNCRSEDIIARWGGDEFVILLPQTDTKDAWLLCKRFISSCNNLYVKDVPVSMAAGVATKTDAAEDLLGVLREAEDNMYKQKLTESRSAKGALLKALLKTLAEKSFETETHTLRMQKIGQKIGQALDLPEAELNRLNLLITLHDIGKINIPESILVKNGPLSPEEWKMIKKHPEIGFRIARATEEFAHVAEDILTHHERWDGTGYPQGLKNSEIPLLARITAIADAHEVMINGRPYKKAMSADEITAEFKRCAGSHFDPALVDIYLSLSK